MLAKAQAEDAPILLEGAQGALLDPDFGTYPYCTSSSPLSAGSCLGTGIAPARLKHVLGIFKAYQTRVGTGPMPTELFDDIGDAIRECAHEYGTTTGRPRRCGWFDAVAARLSSRVNGFRSAAITRLDVLDCLSSIKICTGYKLDGEIIDYFPASIPVLENCHPVYEDMPGWETSTEDARKFEDLPPKAQDYVNRLEELIECPVSLISVGMRREQTVQKLPVF
jgi:adenylosuccinate synthase